VFGNPKRKRGLWQSMKSSLTLRVTRRCSGVGQAVPDTFSVFVSCVGQAVPDTFWVFVRHSLTYAYST